MSNTHPFQNEQYTLDYYVGKTPLVRLQRLNQCSATVLAKLEGNNPAGSVKDRPAYNMIMQAERRGQIKPGDTLIEATSGNTGIALAMVAAMRGYQMKLIMPDNMSQERKDAMLAYGAELIEVTKEQGMILDWNKSIELSANKVDLAKDLLKMLIKSFEKEQQEMQQLIDDEDFPQLEHNLHRLYGASRYIGVPKLQDISGEFEQFVSQLRKQKKVADDIFIEQVAQRFAKLVEAMQQVKLAAQPYLSED